MTDQDFRLANVAITLVIAFVILYIGTFVASSVIQVDAGGSDEEVSTAAELDGTEWTQIESNIGTDPTVYNSLGNAVNTTGANDSWVKSTQDVEFASDESWTVATWARVDPESADENMTVISADGSVVIGYDGQTDEWWAWYYDQSNRNSHMVRVDAPNQPANYTHISVVSDGDTISIYRDAANKGDEANLNDSSSVDAPINSSNWDGRIEETRAFDDALSSSELQPLVDDPIEPGDAHNRTVRIMYDEADRDTQEIFFSDASLQTSNVTYSAGFEGKEMDEDGMIISGDLEWDTTGPRIRAVAGGDLEGQPVAYVSYTRQSILDIGRLASDWTAAVALAGVMLILLPLGTIMLYVRGIRQSR